MDNYHEATKLEINMLSAHVLRLNYLYQRGRYNECKEHIHHIKRILPNDLTMKYDLSFLSSIT